MKTTTTVMQLIALLFLLCAPVHAAATGTDTVAVGDDADTFYRAYRETEANHNTSPDPRAKKFLDAMAPAEARYKTPLKLVDKQTAGDETTLHYKAADPNTDLSVDVVLTKTDAGQWKVKEDSFNGKANDEMSAAIWKNLTAAYPAELTGFAVSGIFVLLGLLAAWIIHIWLLVIAFRFSLLWGFASLFLPFALLIFVITHWQISKKAFLSLLAADAVVIVGLSTPVAIFAADGGFDALKPTTAEVESAQKTDKAK